MKFKNLAIFFGVAIQFCSAAYSQVPNNVPIHQFLNTSTGQHFLTSNYQEGVNAGFLYNGVEWMGNAATEAPEGYHMVYRCVERSKGTDHFVSVDPNCEGQITEGSLGYVASNPLPGTSPLFRFYRIERGYNDSGNHRRFVEADHWMSTSQSSAMFYGRLLAYTSEGIIGYVQKGE